jgi:uncharacterized protein YhbP (UPF0306 family)
MTISYSIRSDRFPPGRVTQSVVAILDTCDLLALSTVTPEGKPYANTAYFAYTHALDIVIYTPPSTQHARNLEADPAAAAAIYRADQPVGADLQGLQVFGEMRKAIGSVGDAAFAAYATRFSWLAEAATSIEEADGKFESRLYVMRVDTLKLFDEPVFGKETWVSARVERN